MSKYILKFYKGKKLIAETSFDSKDYEPGDAELSVSMAGQIATECAGMIEEAVQCNPPEGSAE